VASRRSRHIAKHRASTFQAPPPGNSGEEGQLYGLKLRREDRRLAFVIPRDYNATPRDYGDGRDARDASHSESFDLPRSSLAEHGGHGNATRAAWGLFLHREQRAAWGLFLHREQRSVSESRQWCDSDGQHNRRLVFERGSVDDAGLLARCPRKAVARMHCVLHEHPRLHICSSECDGCPRKASPQPVCTVIR
jgi:hypothetical protein